MATATLAWSSSDDDDDGVPVITPQTDLDIFRALTAEERADLRRQAIAFVRNEILVVGEIPVRAAALIASSQRERAELNRSATALSRDQTERADRAVAILRSSEESVASLEQGFRDIDSMIGSMQSVASYDRLRKLHYYRQHSSDVVQWCTVFDSMEDPTMYYEAINRKEFRGVYDDIRVVQKIRMALADSAGRFRSQVLAMRPVFDVVDELIHALVQKALQTLTDCADIALDAFTNDDTNTPSMLALREAFHIAIQEIDAEADTGGALLYTGGAGSEAVGYIAEDAVGPLCLEAVVEAIEHGVDRVFETAVLADIEDPYKMLGKSCKAVEETLPEFLSAIEEVTLPMETPKGLQLTTIVISRFHDDVLELFNGFLDPNTEAESTSLVRALQCLEWYKETLVECGAIVSQYTDTSELPELHQQLLEAAVTGLRDHMVDLALKCSLRVVKDASVVEDEGDGHIYTTGASDLLYMLHSTVKSVATAASLAVLHKLAVGAADALQAYVEDMVNRIEWDAFHTQVEVALREYEAHHAKPAKRGKGAEEEAPPPEEGEQSKPPLAMEEADTHWLKWQCATINDLVAIKADIPKVEHYFDALLDADEVELRLANAVSLDAATAAPNASGETAAVEWQSPVRRVVADIGPVTDTLIDRMVEYVSTIVLWPNWENMFTSNEWQLNPTPSNPLDAIFKDLHDYIDACSVFLQHDAGLAFRRELMWTCTVQYVERLARFLKSGKKKWIYAKNVDRDIDLMQLFWSEHTLVESVGSREMLQLCNDGLKAILTLMTAPTVDAIVVHMERLMVMRYPDCPGIVIETILRNRNDVDKKTREKMLEAFQIAWENRNAAPPPTPSLLGCVKEAFVLEPPPRRGWLRSAKPVAPKSLGSHKPAHRRTASAPEVIHVDATGATPTRQIRTKVAADHSAGRRRLAKAGPKGAEVHVVSLADLQNAASTTPSGQPRHEVL